MSRNHLSLKRRSVICRPSCGHDVYPTCCCKSFFSCCSVREYSNKRTRDISSWLGIFCCAEEKQKTFYSRVKWLPFGQLTCEFWPLTFVENRESPITCVDRKSIEFRIWKRTQCLRGTIIYKFNHFSRSYLLSFCSLFASPTSPSKRQNETVSKALDKKCTFICTV